MSLRPRRELVLGLAVLALTSGSLGCRKIRERMQERALEKASGGKVDIEHGGDTVTIKGDKPGDQLVVGKDAKLPDDFPKTVPIYPGAKIIGSYAASGAAGKDKGFTVQLETTDAPDKVVAFYKSKMPGGSAAQQFEMNGPTGHVLTYKDGTNAVSVITAASTDNKTTSITLTVGTNKS